MTRPLVLNPRNPIPLKLSEESDTVHWICAECGQIHLTEDEAYKCCQIVPWPLDYTI